MQTSLAVSSDRLPSEGLPRSSELALQPHRPLSYARNVPWPAASMSRGNGPLSPWPPPRTTPRDGQATMNGRNSSGKSGIGWHQRLQLVVNLFTPSVRAMGR